MTIEELKDLNAKPEITKEDLAELMGEHEIKFDTQLSKLIGIPSGAFSDAKKAERFTYALQAAIRFFFINLKESQNKLGISE